MVTGSVEEATSSNEAAESFVTKLVLKFESIIGVVEFEGSVLVSLIMEPMGVSDVDVACVSANVACVSAKETGLNVVVSEMNKCYSESFCYVFFVVTLEQYYLWLIVPLPNPALLAQVQRPNNA